MNRVHLPRRLAVACVATALGAATIAGSSTGAAAPKRDKDCADFATQADAQAYFNQRGAGDPDNLDGDGDGVACESNPCPCSTAHGGGSGGGNHHRHGRRTGARVSHVTDGDTVAVRVNGHKRAVRLIGIDTPEVYFGRECGGEAASRAMKRMLHHGERVHLVRDFSQDNRDRYGRLLRYVIDGSTDVGRRQLARGKAKVYVYSSNNFNRVRPYRRAQKHAKHHHRGSWKSCHGHFHRGV